MNPYINYKISGLSGIGVIAGEDKFNVDDDDIEYIQLTGSKGEIQSIKVSLYSTVSITSEVSNRINNRINLFVAELFGKFDADACGFSIEVETYDPNKPAIEEDESEFHSTISMEDCVFFSPRDYSISDYKDAFDSISVETEKQDSVMLFLNIMKIDNTAIRYLMLYELLMKLVAKKTPSQRQVTKFIRNDYNPKCPTEFDHIGFKPTRKSGKKYKVDILTYQRNLLAHNDSCAQSEEAISIMCKGLVRVILYKINQGPESSSEDDNNI